MGASRRVQTTFAAACTAAMRAGLSDTRKSLLNQRTTVWKGGADGEQDGPLSAPAPFPLMTTVLCRIPAFRLLQVPSHIGVASREPAQHPFAIEIEVFGQQV